MFQFKYGPSRFRQRLGFNVGLITKAIGARIRSSLRYKLLTLVLLPIFVAMPITLALAIYWLDNDTRTSLLRNVRANLVLSRSALNHVQQNYLAKLQQAADSYEFRTLVQTEDTEGLRHALRRLIAQQGFVFIHVTDDLGHWLYERYRGDAGSSKPTPLTGRAMRGKPAAALEVFTLEDLRRESSTLPDQVVIQLVNTSREVQQERTVEKRAMVLRAIYPISSTDGRVLAFLDGGVLINNNTSLVNAIRDQVYHNETLPAGGVGAVSLLLDNIRISTNIPLGPEETALGTRVTSEVRRHVLGQGRMWTARESIGGRWYISAYEPLFDVHGLGVGMLHTGFLEAPFRYAHYGTLAVLFLVFLTVIAISAGLALRGARAIFQPIETMAAVVRATQAGADRRIGTIDSQDEIGELARQFDTMLDLLQHRNLQIQRAAEELEVKVKERTRELESKNADLEATIELLHKTRQQLVLAEKLAALGELAAGIAHEINNPTAVILGNIDILEAELGKAAEPVEVEIDLIVQQVDRIRHIVNSLLQFSRPSPQPSDMQNIDVNLVIKDTLPLISYGLEKGSIVVRKRFRASHTVRINKYELQQVLINLIINASHAVSTAGIIEIATENWDEEGVVISIRDNGPGIAPERLQRIFDPFFTSEPSRGTGLGLSVSYGIAQRYGGDITAHSEVGKGSVFCVWLLCEPEPAARDARPQDAQNN